MKKIVGLVCIALVFSLSACGEKNDATKFKEEYEELNGTTREKDNKKIRSLTIADDNPFVYASASKISKMIDKDKTFIVYFGFADCPWCRSMIETLIKEAKAYNISKIYYVDVKDIRDIKELKGDKVVETTKGSKAYYELLKQLNNVLDEYTIESNGEKVSVNEKRIYAPNIVLVKDGDPIVLRDGVSDSLNDPYTKLTKQNKTEMKTEIDELLKLMNDVCDLGC